jgi:hypothetical protein
MYKNHKGLLVKKPEAVMVRKQWLEVKNYINRQLIISN